MRKTKQLIIVDGYNILNAWEKYEKFLKMSLEDARMELISDVAEFSKLEGEKLLLVFDAYKVSVIGTDENIKGIEVVYTNFDETADQYIEKKLDTLGKKILVTVCTDDSLIQKLAMQRGGIILTSEEFLFRYENLKNKMKRYESKNRIQNKSYINTLDEKIIKKIDEIGKKLFDK